MVSFSETFLISLFSGIASAAIALAAEGYTVIGIAIAENDPAARQVIFAPYPQAIDLGDITIFDRSRLKSTLKDFLRVFARFPYIFQLEI